MSGIESEYSPRAFRSTSESVRTALDQLADVVRALVA